MSNNNLIPHYCTSAPVYKHTFIDNQRIKKTDTLKKLDYLTNHNQANCTSAPVYCFISSDNQRIKNTDFLNTQFYLINHNQANCTSAPVYCFISSDNQRIKNAGSLKIHVSWVKNNIVNCTSAPDESHICTRYRYHCMSAPCMNRTFAPDFRLLLHICTLNKSNRSHLHPIDRGRLHIYTRNSTDNSTFAPDKYNLSTFAPDRSHFYTL